MPRFFISLVLLLPICAAAQEEIRDPTRPPSPSEVEAWFGNGPKSDSTGRFRLQSVLLAPGRRIAIIDGQRLRPGDTIDNAFVSAIETGRVILEREGETIELNIETHLTKDNDGLGN